MSVSSGALAVSVVIPTFNRAATLHRCLEHLSRQTVGADAFEVIVADDASSDDTESVVEQWTRRSRFAFRYLRCDKGFAGAARNRGSAIAQGDRLLYLGDDILAAPDLVENHLGAARRHGACSVIVGEVVLDGDRPLPPFMSFLEESGTHHDFPTLHQYGARPIPGRYFYACNASLPRRAFQATSGFDETIKRAWEDSEFGCRLAAAGWSLHFEPTARGVHVHPLTLKSYMAFRRRGRDDIARAAERMRFAGESLPTVVPHPVLDRIVSDRVVDLVASSLSVTDRWWPRPTRHALYRRLIRYENRRALQQQDPL